MLTDRKGSLQNSMVVETGLSDHHKMTVTLLNNFYKKKDPIIRKYRCYEYFIELDFRNDLLKCLHSFNPILPEGGGVESTTSLVIIFHSTHFLMDMFHIGQVCQYFFALSNGATFTVKI